MKSRNHLRAKATLTEYLTSNYPTGTDVEVADPDAAKDMASSLTSMGAPSTLAPSSTVRVLPKDRPANVA